ncbi:MAG: hypothetical protein NC084_04095 [Bacteroides sp.]|nr:hypothetical protein [Eubacterium sp.]MCM1417653.1 hypothetical protein [Roseburia sp.]MCM1461882.1 hypothetical protein [Bacteroides sp.]
MKISNVKIYDLEESIIASGYPMETDTEADNDALTEKDMARAKRLRAACDKDNPAHGQFLTGIRVNFDLTFTVKAWTEAERYRFLEFVSSQSTMHRISKFNLDEQYCEYVDPRMIEIMKELKDRYNETKAPEDYLHLLYSNPCGFQLTARLTTNYRCLANIYKQRKNHRLPEWREFCAWIETLPYAKELILGGE